jgi:polar amino acid transport system substrate-binding protein
MKTKLFILLIPLAGLFAQEKPLAGVHLDMGMDFPSSWERAKAIIRIFDELSLRLGFTYDYDQYPTSRLSFMTQVGEVDGQFMKTYAYGETQPNLVRVPTSYFSQTLQVYSNSPEIQISHWSDMSDYTLAVMRGIQAFEGPISLYLNESHIVGLKDMKACVLFVELGRADLTILSDFLAEQMKVDTSFDLYLSGELDTVDMYLYLHKSYEKYIPIIDETLKTMKEEGIF